MNHFHFSTRFLAQDEAAQSLKAFAGDQTLNPAPGGLCGAGMILAFKVRAEDMLGAL